MEGLHLTTSFVGRGLFFALFSTKGLNETEFTGFISGGRACRRPLCSQASCVGFLSRCRWGVGAEYIGSLSRCRWGVGAEYIGFLSRCRWGVGAELCNVPFSDTPYCATCHFSMPRSEHYPLFCGFSPVILHKKAGYISPCGTAIFS
jgi:hypothetical protein